MLPGVMLLILHLLTPFPEGVVKTQQHLAAEQILVISLSSLMVFNSTLKMMYFDEKSSPCGVSLQQESIGTLFLSFVCIVCHVCLPVWLRRQILAASVHLALPHKG